MKRIIVPIDFSALSLNGLKLASVIGEFLNADLEMVHVIKNKENHFRGKSTLEVNKIRERLDEIIKDFKELHPDVSYSRIVKEGKIHEEVANQAGAFKDSMIVTSTHGKSGWEELFIGSNAYKVVSSSTKPVT